MSFWFVRFSIIVTCVDLSPTPLSKNAFLLLNSDCMIKKVSFKHVILLTTQCQVNNKTNSSGFSFEELPNFAKTAVSVKNGKEEAVYKLQVFTNVSYTVSVRIRS